MVVVGLLALWDGRLPLLPSIEVQVHGPIRRDARLPPPQVRFHHLQRCSPRVFFNQDGVGFGLGLTFFWSRK